MVGQWTSVSCVKWLIERGEASTRLNASEYNLATACMTDVLVVPVAQTTGLPLPSEMQAGWTGMWHLGGRGPWLHHFKTVRANCVYTFIDFSCGSRIEIKFLQKDQAESVIALGEAPELVPLKPGSSARLARFPIGHHAIRR